MANINYLIVSLVLKIRRCAGAYFVGDLDLSYEHKGQSFRLSLKWFPGYSTSWRLEVSTKGGNTKCVYYSRIGRRESFEYAVYKILIAS